MRDTNIVYTWNCGYCAQCFTWYSVFFKFFGEDFCLPENCDDDGGCGGGGGDIDDDGGGDDEDGDGGDHADDDVKMMVHWEEKSCWRSIDGESWRTLASASATQYDEMIMMIVIIVVMIVVIVVMMMTRINDDANCQLMEKVDKIGAHLQVLHKH